jgi:hypothetical protein
VVFDAGHFFSNHPIFWTGAPIKFFPLDDIPLTITTLQDHWQQRRLSVSADTFWSESQGFSMASNAAEDPNRITWAQYLKEEDDNHSSDEEEDDFRGDSLNDADWDGQGRGTAKTRDELKPDFTKQYNRQKVILQNDAAGKPPQQGPKRNPQASAPATVPPAAYTSRKAGEYDSSVDALNRYAGRINLKDDDSR